MNTYLVKADFRDYKAPMMECSFSFEAESDEAAFRKADEFQTSEGFAPHIPSDLDAHFFANNLYRVKSDDFGSEQRIKLER